jgi:hypothetical protein
VKIVADENVDRHIDDETVLSFSREFNAICCIPALSSCRRVVSPPNKNALQLPLRWIRTAKRSSAISPFFQTVCSAFARFGLRGGGAADGLFASSFGGFSGVETALA